MKYPFTISIAIPAYNEEKYIGSTLESILKNPPENLKEIVVINNACTDKTAEVASKYSLVKVVDEPQKGLLFARHRGFTATSGDLLAFIDADTKIRAEWFNIINEEFSEHPDTVCLSGPYYYYDVPKWQKIFVRIWSVITQATYSVTQYMAMGGNFVVKRQALIDIGGFDTTISFYGEDTDLVKRLSEVGKIKFSQTFTVDTSGRRFAGEGLFRTAMKYGINYASVMMLKKPLTKKYKDIR